MYHTVSFFFNVTNEEESQGLKKNLILDNLAVCMNLDFLRNPVLITNINITVSLK